MDMVASCFVTKGHRFSSSILLPIVNHAILARFPASLIHRVKPDIALAFGPFIGVSASAYVESGGHASHPDHIVDDVQSSPVLRVINKG